MRVSIPLSWRCVPRGQRVTARAAGIRHYRHAGWDRTHRRKRMSSVATDIDVRRVAGSIGAEITGVRVGPDLPGPVVKLIRDTLLEHKVVFFRGQHDLDDVTQA